MMPDDTVLCVKLDQDDLASLPEMLNPLLQPFGVMLVRDSSPPADRIGTINLMALTIQEVREDKYSYTNTED